MAGTYDVTFDCNGQLTPSSLDSFAELQGLQPNVTVDGLGFDVLADLTGAGVPGVVVVCAPLESVSTLLGKSEVTTYLNNIVGWSKIGDIRFKLDRMNDAGYRPMPFRGWVYRVLSLGKSLVVYGSDGIASMEPTGVMYGHLPPTFSLKGLLSIGLSHPLAVVEGEEGQHFFIDKQGFLWKITEKGPEQLGYREFFKDTVVAKLPWVLTYDRLWQRLYICNGAVGYIYTDKGLGQGPGNITGIAKISETTYFARARNQVEAPYPDVVTDILDFGTRDTKTITAIRLGVASALDWQVAIDYRWNIHNDWKTTPYRTATKKGLVGFNVSGAEFRIRIRSVVTDTSQLTDFDYFDIDYDINDSTYKQLQHRS